MLQLDPDVVAIIAVIAAGVALLSLLLLLVLALRLRRLRKGLQRALGEHGDDLVEVLGSHSTQLDAARRSMGELEGRVDDLRDQVKGTVSRVGVVRYDAFDDMGGALSFSPPCSTSTARLVISAINGRSETRCYGKPIVRGESEHHLSDEETEAAIDAAIEGRPPAIASPRNPAARRRRDRDGPTRHSSPTSGLRARSRRPLPG
jgi:hypothetical protein